MENLCINTLIFEVTRRCNMSCAHCMRGKAENVTMSDEVIDRVINNLVGYNINVTTIVPSGGEPTLVPRKIKKILLSELDYGDFYLVTNGLIYSPTTVNVLNEAYKRIMDNPYSDFNGGLSISRDQFHVKNNEVYTKYWGSCEPFFLRDREERIGDKGIINDGNAKKNKIGSRTIEKHIGFELDSDNKGNYYPEFYQIYINALGDVILGCDYSYETQKKYAIGNVLKQNLTDILESFANKEITKAKRNNKKVA